MPGSFFPFGMDPQIYETIYELSQGHPAPDFTFGGRFSLGPMPEPTVRSPMTERLQPNWTNDWNTMEDIMDRPTWYSDPDMPRVLELYNPGQFYKPEQYERLNDLMQNLQEEMRGLRGLLG
jgi:hypothetical protein